MAPLDEANFEPGMIHYWDEPGEGFGCFFRQAEEWNGLVIENREKRGEGREDGKEGVKEGEGKEKRERAHTKRR